MRMRYKGAMEQRDRTRGSRRVTTTARCVQSLAVLGAGLFLLFPGGSVEAAPENSASSYLRTMEIVLPTIELPPQHTMHMEGPYETGLFTGEKEGALYVHSFAVELTDSRTGKDLTEFMCHSVLYQQERDIPAKRLEKKIRNGQMGISYLSQGRRALTMPEGFALVTDDVSVKPLGLVGMATTYDTVKKTQHIKYTGKLEYWSERDAKRLGIKPLYFVTYYGGLEVGKQIGTKGEHGHHGHELRTHDERAVHKNVSYHWTVPPGRFTYRTTALYIRGEEYVREGTRAHVLRMHVHPYTESFSVFDKTAGKTIWQGKAFMHRTRAELTGVDVWSSKTGVLLYPDHEYELTVTMNNTSGHDVNGMVNLRAYVH